MHAYISYTPYVSNRFQVYIIITVWPFRGHIIGVHGLCDDLYQRDAMLGFADYHVDVDGIFSRDLRCAGLVCAGKYSCVLVSANIFGPYLLMLSSRLMALLGGKTMQNFLTGRWGALSDPVCFL